jgi:hypothetical protein
MAKLDKKDTQTNLRGLGCGAPKPPGKLSKTCVDCGKKAVVKPDQMICDDCDGPLTSRYDA